MKLVRNFAWMTASRLGAAVIQAVSLLLVARQAGPAEFGVLAAFMGTIIVLQAIMDLGLPTFITKSRARSSEDQQVLRALQLYGRIGIFLGLLLCLTGALFAGFYGQAWWWLIPLALAGWLERQSDVRLTVALADGDVWKISLNLVVRRTASLLLLLIGMNLEIEAVFAFGVASMLASVLSWFLSQKLVVLPGFTKKTAWNHSKEIIVASRAYWANSLGAQLRNLDVLLVGLIGNPIAAGHYGAVARSIGPLRMVTASLATVLLPAAVRRSGSRKDLLVPLMAVLGVMSVVYIILLIFAGDIILRLLGSEYVPATLAFQLMVGGLIFASLTSVLTPLLQARGSQGVVGQLSILFSILSLGGVALGTFYGGVSGAGLGLSITYVLHSLVLSGVFLLTRKKELEVRNV
ncbi:lipopolysaccharide biosynthesis protein [Kocuria sp. M1N1S27]|uniref:lipopolysaccharide biosynthesis protein n=1 Tax=Kocuria kalidii TaxID=3376283 RepID=UPI0037B6C01A